MLCLSVFELYSRWVPLMRDGYFVADKNVKQTFQNNASSILWNATFI